MMKIRMILLAVLLALSSHSLADSDESGFLDDYSRLEPVPGSERVSRYLAPGATEKLAKVTAVMIPQPTVIIAKDSKFQGAKPDDLKALADSFQALMAEQMGKDFMIAQNQAPGVLVLNFAITDVYLKKPKRHLWGYLPPALVLGTVKNKVFDSFEQNIDLTGANFEAELLMSGTNEQLGAIVDKEGSRKDKQLFTSWAEFETKMHTLAMRFACRIKNAKAGAGTPQNCEAIEAPAPSK